MRIPFRWWTGPDGRPLGPVHATRLPWCHGSPRFCGRLSRSGRLCRTGGTRGRRRGVPRRSSRLAGAQPQ
ncbi:hypothetical protein FM125_07435 [Micrococcus lylae]|uniref:Uncharacterized protein n=1 Tax=Micrococcus lylae TaxID=1273 RepID=A0A1R4JAW3_9MICC|nr:hypothetical protein FM125_07435 [Micrococcus lylae]